MPRHSRRNREGGEKYSNSSKRDNTVNHLFAISHAYRPPALLYKCSLWSNLGLGGHSYELVPGLGINVGEALRRSEAPRLRPEVLERDRPAECLWLRKL